MGSCSCRQVTIEKCGTTFSTEFQPDEENKKIIENYRRGNEHKRSISPILEKLREHHNHSLIMRHRTLSQM